MTSLNSAALGALGRTSLKPPQIITPTKVGLPFDGAGTRVLRDEVGKRSFLFLFFFYSHLYFSYTLSLLLYRTLNYTHNIRKQKKVDEARNTQKWQM